MQSAQHKEGGVHRCPVHEVAAYGAEPGVLRWASLQPSSQLQICTSLLTEINLVGVHNCTTQHSPSETCLCQKLSLTHMRRWQGAYLQDKVQAACCGAAGGGGCSSHVSSGAVSETPDGGVLQSTRRALDDLLMGNILLRSILILLLESCMPCTPAAMKRQGPAGWHSGQGTTQ
jgi:hypothetical protein